MPEPARTAELTGMNFAVACVYMIAPVVALSAQCIFVFNLVQAIVGKL
jgi:hypothetical protein